MMKDGRTRKKRERERRERGRLQVPRQQQQVTPGFSVKRLTETSTKQAEDYVI